MAGPNESGTPQEPTAGGQQPGTADGGADGGLMAGLTADQKALFLAQEKKAAEGNAALKRAAELEARIAELEARQYQPQVQQQNNPWAEIQQRAAYGDTEAIAQVNQALMGAVAVQQAENTLTTLMVKAGVRGDQWDAVSDLVRQSGYRMGVPQALQLVSGKDTPVLQEQLKAKDEEIRRLRETIDQRSTNGSAPKVSVSTPPAPSATEEPEELTAAEYAAIIRAGGERAQRLRNGNVRFKR